MARTAGGGGGSRSGGGGRSLGGGSRSRSLSFSGSGRSRGTGGGGPRRAGSSSGFGGGSSSFGGGSHHHHTSHHHHHTSHHHHPTSHHHHTSYHRPHHHHHGHTHYRSSSSSGGCASLAAFFIVLIIVLAALASQGGFGGGSGSNQKLNKTKYTGKVDSSQGYYIDDSDPSQGGFITYENESTLNSGFKEFYNKTGVFPFLYIMENTPDKSEYSGYATYQDKLYEELFEADGNLLILYIAEEDDYYFAGGLDTGDVIDESAVDIISNKVNSYWSKYNGDLGKAFGYGLRDASKNIMAKSNARVIGITIVVALALIVIIAIAFKWWKSKVAQENKEQEDLERTLNTPLESFGSTPIDDLSKKYDDDPTNDPS